MMISMGQAARILGVTPVTVRRWTESGLLPCVRTPGGHRRVAREDVIELSRAIGDSNQAAVRTARERELETLVEASIAVAGQLEQEALLVEIAKHVTRLCRCDSCTIGRYRPEDDTVVIVAEFDAGGRAKGAPGVYAMSEFPATREVLESQEPLVVNADDPRADPAERADLRRWGDRSNLMIPLVFRGRSIGLLEAVDWERERSYSRQELRLVRALAGHAAVALRNAELYQAADSADAAFREFHERMGAASARLRETSGSTGPVDPLAAIATAIRDAFAAHLVVMALDGTVVAAGPDPAADEAAAGRADAHVLTSGADTPRGRLAVTAATSAGATDGDDDLLELATSFAALALRCDEAGVAH